MPTVSIDVEQRRARLAVRHRLLPHLRSDDPAAIADSLVALHSSDPVTVYLSVFARMSTPTVAAVDWVLYADRTLIRHHAMRRTLWVATPETVRLMHAAATRTLIAPERRRLCGLLVINGVEDADRWLADAEHQILTDLAEHGPSTARAVGERLPALRLPLVPAPGKTSMATQPAHTRLLLGLGFAGRVLRAQPAGSWAGGAYAYAAADEWLPGGLGELDSRQAAAALTERWLRAFGPATGTDLQWWMGWTVATTKRALADCAAEPVELGDRAGWVAPGDAAVPEIETTEPWVAVLPSLDPTTMGWHQRDWYLPPAAADAFDRNGNAGPTLWVDGRVVGAWAQARDGEIRLHYFERVAPARRAEIDERVAVLRQAIGPTRFTVRFPGRINATLLPR